MHAHLRRHIRSEQGFTLIELLVVILIIGILAAVAIPTFLSQTNKAADANLESALGTAHLTESTYKVSNGQYAQSTSLSSNSAAISALTAVESSLTSPTSTYSMTLSQYPTTANGGNATSGYQITGTDSKGVTFTLQYTAGTGAVVKTCSPSNTAGCNASGSWG